jgi:hypothetical protein
VLCKVMENVVSLRGGLCRQVARWACIDRHRSSLDRCCGERLLQRDCCVCGGGGRLDLRGGERARALLPPSS